LKIGTTVILFRSIDIFLQLLLCFVENDVSFGPIVVQTKYEIQSQCACLVKFQSFQKLCKKGIQRLNDHRWRDTIIQPWCRWYAWSVPSNQNSLRCPVEKLRPITFLLQFTNAPPVPKFTSRHCFKESLDLEKPLWKSKGAFVY